MDAHLTALSQTQLPLPKVTTVLTLIMLASSFLYILILYFSFIAGVTNELRSGLPSILSTPVLLFLTSWFPPNFMGSYLFVIF